MVGLTYFFPLTAHAMCRGQVGPRLCGLVALVLELGISIGGFGKGIIIRSLSSSRGSCEQLSGRFGCSHFVCEPV